MTKERLPKSPPPIERRLLPGAFTVWDDNIYEIGERNPTDPLMYELKPHEGGESLFIRLEQMIMSTDDTNADILVAASYDELMDLIESATPLAPAPADSDLPKTFVARADAMLAVVEQVDAIVAEEEARAHARGEKWSRTAAIKRACANLDPPIGPATYYRFRKRIAVCQGQRARIAASMRRRIFGKKKATPAQFHFVDTLIMRFYARRPPIRPMSLYRIATSTLDRTRGYWIDPTTCTTVPPNLVEELLDEKLPIDLILGNPDKASLLTPTKLPSRGWFFEYLHYMRNQPQQGKTIFVSRYGQDAWEQHFMVFDTFLARATLPLQYVFVDHWLLDVFTVDEATRSETDRVWLTVLIDAFSRSIIGFALLYEPPCIESIQNALRHGIWPKTSHRTQLNFCE